MDFGTWSIHSEQRDNEKRCGSIDEIAGAHRVEGELIASQLITPLVDYVQVYRAPASSVQPGTDSKPFIDGYIIILLIVSRLPRTGRNVSSLLFFPFIPFLLSLIHLPQPTSLFLFSPLIRAMRVSMPRFLF